MCRLERSSGILNLLVNLNHVATNCDHIEIG
jgi:hypothetical protein